MKKTIFNSVALVLAASFLVGCGDEIPSCGDAEATKLVSQILAENVTKDTGSLEEEFKKRVSFSIEQPVVVQHDEKVSRYSCKAVGTYTVSPELHQKLQRTDTDNAYQAAVYRSWRKQHGLYSSDDVGFMVMEFEKPDTPKETKDQLRAEIAQVLGIDQNFDTRILAGGVLAYPAAQRNQEIRETTALLQHALKSVDDTTKKIPVNVEYTISKIDEKGGKKFQVEVNSDSDMLQGIQSLEVLHSAALLTEKMAAAKQAASVPAKVAAAQSAAPSPAVEAQPAVAATQSVEQAQSEPKAAIVPTSVESKPQAVVQPEATKKLIEASFDCAKASSKIEKLICSTPETANADKRLSVAYNAAKAKASDEKKLKAEQLDWLKQKRNACEDSACLLRVTEERVQVLQ